MKRTIFLSVSLLIAGLVGPTNAQDIAGVKIKPTVKRAGVARLRSLNLPMPILLQLSEKDFVNVRSNPTTTEIKVTGGMVADKSGAKVTRDDLTDLLELPEGSLVTNEQGIQFTRPKTNRRIFLDLEVPVGMTVVVFINDRQVLNGQVQEPIALFKGRKMAGSKNAAGTFLRTICTDTDSHFPTFPSRN